MGYCANMFLLACAYLLLGSAPLCAASPVMTSRYGSDWVAEEAEEFACRDAWDRVGHICWGLVPAYVTISDSGVNANFYCRLRGARALRLYGHDICMQDTRLRDSEQEDDLVRRELGIRDKRLMGNNGY
ncbi:hypothetical protein ACOMHN_008678 [Nucella lapillus]